MLYSKYGGTEVTVDGEDLLVLDRDVLPRSPRARRSSDEPGYRGPGAAAQAHAAAGNGADQQDAAPWASFASAFGPVTLARVRDRFMRSGYVPPAVPLLPGSRRAAVLVPVFEEAGEAHVLFTRSPDTMPSHRGDIAFPGGKIEPGLDVNARAGRSPRGRRGE